MNLNILLKVQYVCIVLLVTFCGYQIKNTIVLEKKEEAFISSGKMDNSPDCLQMYYSIETYSKEFNIPKYIAYNIAYRESRYKGPFDWDYKPDVTSSVGAVGPMQIMPATASWIHGEDINSKKLKTDINFNVRTSMKILRNLHNTYKDWKIVCGYYNTGNPIVNEYAIYCSTVNDYELKWIKPN